MVRGPGEGGRFQVIADFQLPIVNLLADTLLNSAIDNRQLEIGNDLKSPPLAIAHQFPYSFGMPHSKSHFSMIFGPRATPSGRLWNPSADVYRSSEGWIVKLDLAGVCSNDLEIELRDSSLTIRGCRKDTHYSEGFVYHQMEITYSRFEKQIQFPDRIEGASVAHDYNDGFFIIKLRSENSSN